MIGFRILGLGSHENIDFSAMSNKKSSGGNNLISQPSTAHCCNWLDDFPSWPFFEFIVLDSPTHYLFVIWMKPFALYFPPISTMTVYFPSPPFLHISLTVKVKGMGVGFQHLLNLQIFIEIFQELEVFLTCILWKEWRANSCYD